MIDVDYINIVYDSSPWCIDVECEYDFCDGYSWCIDVRITAPRVHI